MGTCCGCEHNVAPGEGVQGGEESVEGPKRYLTNEELVDSLINKTNAGGPKAKGTTINLDIIETILLADETQPKEFKRSSERKGTGWVSKDDIDSAANQVTFDKEKSSEDLAKGSGDGRVKARKGTGFVTKEKMMNLLDELSDEEAEQPLLGQDDGAKEPQAVAASAPNIVGAEVKARCKARKGTGFVTKSKLKKVLDAVGDAENDA